MAFVKFKNTRGGTTIINTNLVQMVEKSAEKGKEKNTVVFFDAGKGIGVVLNEELHQVFDKLNK